ncbi:uncharacterized protein [Littorina saxatilis]|uniref:uncharacterized protein n=1 Tax=Littorina saxatilis TaxID=31220 RepID=UPI0038B4AFDC
MQRELTKIFNAYNFPWYTKRKSGCRMESCSSTKSTVLTSFSTRRMRGLCSRHFKETCFKYGKRALIPGSLPTNHVLQKSVETPKTPARKPPVSRPPPPAPDLVTYYNFEEIRQDTLQLAAPWCLLENSKEQIQVGITEASQVKLLSSTL